MSYDKVWQDLERDPLPHGTVRRRVRPSLPHDVFLELSKPAGLRALALRLHGPIGDHWRDIRETRGVSVRVTPETPLVAQVQLAARDKRFHDVFGALVEDLVARLGDDVSKSSLDVLAARLARWQVCLESSGEGLSEERQAGLYAELATLVDVIAPSVGPDLAVRSWHGPDSAHQDFQLGATAVEVKSSRAAKPSAVVISSERQLDTTACARLFLLSISVDARAEGTGRSLPQLVQETRALVGQSSLAREHLEDLLLSAGYLSLHEPRYRTRFSVRSTDVFAVEQGFPRITEADLPAGIGRVTYRLDLAACEAWQTDVDAVTLALKKEADQPR